MPKYTNSLMISGTNWQELNTTEENVAVQWLAGGKLRLAVADSAVDLATNDMAHELGQSVPAANLTELAGRLVVVKAADVTLPVRIAVTKY